MLNPLFNPFFGWYSIDGLDPLLGAPYMSGLWLPPHNPREDTETLSFVSGDIGLEDGKSIPDGDLFQEARFARELDDLRKRCADLQNDNERLRDANATLLETNRKLDTRLSEAKRLIEDGISTFDGLKAHNDTLQQENNTLREKVGQGRGQVEIKTLVQDLDNFKLDDRPSGLETADSELQSHLNQGWEVLNISANSLFDDSNRIFAYTRIVTLKRAKSAPRPQPERVVVRETISTFADPLFGGIIQDAPEPEGDPVLNCIESADFTYAEALKSGQFSAQELRQIGDFEALKPVRELMEQWEARPYTPLPPTVRPVFGRVTSHE